MAAGKRLSLVHQAMVVWVFVDEKAELGYELTQFVDTGSMGSEAEVMPYNPNVLEAIVAQGLWDR